MCRECFLELYKRDWTQEAPAAEKALMEPYFTKYKKFKIVGILEKTKTDYIKVAGMKGFCSTNREEKIYFPYVLVKCGHKACTKAHIFPKEMDSYFSGAMCSALSKGVKFYIQQDTNGILQRGRRWGENLPTDTRNPHRCNGTLTYGG